VGLRLDEHRLALRQKQHHSAKLQADHDAGDRFEFLLLSECDKLDLADREEDFIALLDACLPPNYNREPASTRPGPHRNEAIYRAVGARLAAITPPPPPPPKPGLASWMRRMWRPLFGPPPPEPPSADEMIALAVRWVAGEVVASRQEVWGAPRTGDLGGEIMRIWRRFEAREEARARHPPRTTSDG
jgi:hypothetical protein